MAVRPQFSKDASESLRIVWAAVSLAVLAILLSPFLLGRERVATLVPVCERKARYGLECPFCGMTTSFLNISEARFSDASRANRAGIPLYLGFVSNEICALIFLRRKRTI
jgi:hypothetical protein